MQTRLIAILALLLLVLPHPASGFPIPTWMGAARNYVCQRVAAPPTIDGKLDDKAWAEVTWSQQFVDIEGHLKPAPNHETVCAMLWDDDYFYIAARMVEPHVNAILTQRDAVIYHDNDFEVFIDPDGDNHLYYELEINALNTVWDLLLVKPYRDGAPAVNAWDIQGLRTAVHVDGTLNDPSDVDSGWSVEIAIPWQVLGQCAGRPSPPQAGNIWRVNFSRVQWQYDIVSNGYEKTIDPKTGKTYPEHNWVWSPQGLIAMHCPENWGEVLFVGPDYDGDAEQAINTSTEHASINIARALMDVYYAQKQHYEDFGEFAPTQNVLEKKYGLLLKEWEFEMEATPGRFMAKLNTPAGVMTVNEEGRLIRDPLQPPEDCNCLHPKH